MTFIIVGRSSGRHHETMVSHHARAATQTGSLSRSREAFWEGQLGYPQATVVVLTLFALGLALHAFIGYSLPVHLNPVCWLAGLAVPVSLVLGRLGRKHRIIHWLTGIPVAVVVTTAVGVLTIVGGVIPSSVLSQRIGLPTIWTSWPFILLVDLLMVNLVGSVGKRMFPLTYKNLVYVTTHAGLAIAIGGGAMSSLFLTRDVMVLFGGQSTNEVHRPDGSVAKLPFSVELKEFHLKTYPPVLAVATLDPAASGGMTVTPGEHFVKEGASFTVDKNRVKVLDYLPSAVYAGETFKSAPWKTAAPAAKLRLETPAGRVAEGWVSCGSVDTPQEHLKISGDAAIVMPDPRPKEFRSDIVVTAGSGRQSSSVRVNEPIHVAGYDLYQLSYDERAGAASAYSTLEVVRDPGIGWVYFGMGLMLLGSMLHLWNGLTTERGARS